LYGFLAGLFAEEFGDTGYNNPRPNFPCEPTTAAVPGPYDLFISFHRGCSAPVKRLALALESLGVSCSTNDGEAGAELPAELPASRALLAWGSEDYFRSRACQRHLAAAFIARRREPSGSPERILLINARAGVKHIYPVHLRDLQFAPAPELPDAPGFTALAESLRKHCSGLAGTLGELCPPAPANWREAFDSLEQPALRFEGRERELWDIHEALHPAASGAAARQPVAVSAIAGQGKSALAREYAFRFGPAYPGGVFRLAAGEAKPAASVAELSENPPLKRQLLGLLRQLSPECDPDGLDVPALSGLLGAALARAGQPFLWIVDDLPAGLNGPAFRQWLAPETAAPWGRTLITSRSRQYDAKAESLHLPPLDSGSASRLLIREAPPTGDMERKAVATVIENLDRHAMSMALAGALAELDWRNRHRRYADLCRWMDDYRRAAAQIAARLPDELPKGHEIGSAALLLCAVHALEEPGRDLLRLAAELAEATLPADFIADCFLRSGLSAEEGKSRPFAIFLHEPHVAPMDAAAAHAHAETGMADLDHLSLGERTAGGVRVHPLAARIMNEADPCPARRRALRRAALHALCAVAEHCASGGDWRRLASLAPHARVLVRDLQDRPAADAANEPPDLARKVRLACLLADMEAAHGNGKQALKEYRSLGDYLLRAMTAEPDNRTRQRDFAVIQERMGDLLSSRGDVPRALDCLRRSLGLRTLLAKQDPAEPGRPHDLLRHHNKIGDLLKTRGDPGSALYSYRAAHAIYEKLSAQAPADADRRFDLAASHERLASLSAQAGDTGEASKALRAALIIYEGLAAEHPARLKFVRAPAVIYNLMGDLLRARADLAGALAHYRTALAIAERITALEPAASAWLHDLALCHNNVGSVLEALEDLAGALVHYQAAYPLVEKLAARAPDNEALRKDLARVRERIGSLCEKEAKAS
jgi:tetratricopeptide (TPR) repeat protein